ncbi:shikimate dehydrogenase [Achromobacter xylosoxidans]
MIGNPIAHSRSPQIHAMFARQTGRALRYDRLLAPLDGFMAATAAFVAEGGLGLNVTVPFKQEACALAAGNLSDRARLAGAVNTLSWRNGAWHGCNTDGVGLVSDLLRLGLRLDGARVLLVGAGGAARGVLQPLAQAGCARIHIVNRTAARALELAEAWRASGAGLTSPGHGAARRGGGRGHQCHRQRAGRCRPRPARRPVCARRAGLRHDVRRRAHRLHEAGRGRRRRAHGGRPGHAGGPGGRELPYLARPAARSRARAGGAARRSGCGTLKAWRAAPARAAGPGSGSSPA